MYQLLFIIHGMGAGAAKPGDPHWSESVLTAIKKAAKPFNHDTHFVLANPKAGDVLVTPISYFGFFDKIRKQWDDQSHDAGVWLQQLKVLPDLDAGAKAKLPGWVADAGDFFWTHVLDVILYRFVPTDFTIPIRIEIARQVATARQRADAANGTLTPVHFVSHSLGTAVLHDSLCYLSTKPGFDPKTSAIDSLVTLANVSGILETDYPVYGSADRPGTAPLPPDGLTDAFLSFRHECDPFTCVRQFRGDKSGWSGGGYADDVTKCIKEWNVHGFVHYLNDPQTHMELFRRLWPVEPWPARKAAAIAAYPASPGKPCPVALANLRTELRAIIAAAQSQGDVMHFIDVVIKAINAFKSAEEACKQEQP